MSGPLAMLVLLAPLHGALAQGTSPVRGLEVERRLSERLAAGLEAICPQRPASERVDVVRLDYADLTGDGREDVLVQAVTCAVSFLDVQEVWSLEPSGDLTIVPVRDEGQWRLWPELREGLDANPLFAIRGRTLVAEWAIVDPLLPCHVHRGWRRRVELGWDGERYALASFVTFRPEALASGAGYSEGAEVARWPPTGTASLSIRERCAGDAAQRIEVLRRSDDRFETVASVEGTRAWANLFEWRGRTLLELSSEQLTARGSWVRTELWAVAPEGTLTEVRLSGRGPCAGSLPEIGSAADAYWGSSGFRFATDAMTFDVVMIPDAESPGSRALGRISGTLGLDGDELEVVTCERESARDDDEGGTEVRRSGEDG